jgi:C_GCAxxG_C_C family probable redox protein
LRHQAEDLYRSGKFLCSEAILYTFNEALGRPLPGEVVRLASGFPVGMGALGVGGCSCGALTGGIMVLGMVYGRSNPGDEAPLVLAKAKELHDWFKHQKGSTCCRVLIRDLQFGSPGHIDQCVSFTGDVAEHLAAIIDGN